jgi:hypothetical protein
LKYHGEHYLKHHGAHALFDCKTSSFAEFARKFLPSFAEFASKLLPSFAENKLDLL